MLRACFQSADRRRLSSVRTISVCQRMSHATGTITVAMEVMNINFVVRLLAMFNMMTTLCSDEKCTKSYYLG